MIQLYLLHYNNYYNRTIYREEDIEDYNKYLVKYGVLNTDENGNPNIVDQVNFISTDFVNTDIVVNWVGTMPNYLVEYDSDKQQIRSRWFVVGHEKQNFAQYRLELRRDLVADYFNGVKNQPCFIEKATPSDIYDPALFNSEDMTFNQIKSSESFLYDKTRSAWIVGYVARDAWKDKTKEERTFTSTFPISSQVYANIDTSTWQSDYVAYISYNNSIIDGKGNNKYIMPNDGTLTIKANIGGATEYGELANEKYADGHFNISPINASGSTCTISQLGNTNQTGWVYNKDYTGSLSLYIERGYYLKDFPYCLTNFTNSSSTYSTTRKTIYNRALSKMNVSVNNTLYSEWQQYNGKIIYDETKKKYYRVKILNKNVSTNFGSDYQNDETLDYTFWNNIIKTVKGGFESGYVTLTKLQGTPNNESFTVTSNSTCYYIGLLELPQEATITVPLPNDRYHMDNQPYDMFCIPYPQEYPLTVTGIDNVDAAAGLSIAQNISSSLGSATIYDLQLLPYCPIQEVINGESTIDLSSYDKVYITKKNESGTDVKVNVMLFATTGDFTFDVNYNIPLGKDVEDIKIKSATEMYRLVSPNFASTFEFDPQMNGGVTSFNVDCAYKPFNPYIHINPNFSLYYGKDFNDPRGLICNGDYSLPQSSVAWVEYQYNNKNYNEIFERGIQNMKVNNAVQQEKEKWQMAAGVMQAFAQGKQAGDSTMLGLGGLFGVGNATGLAAAGFSYAAGKRDIELNNQLREEALDYSRDLFGYQLGNIQALNQSLTKVSSFNPNNKIFPIIEHYVPDVNNSAYQANALRNKLHYNGYTIMRIATIDEFLHDEESYIKGTLIRLPEDFDQDFHIGAALAKELDQGVFVKKNLSKKLEEVEETE